MPFFMYPFLASVSHALQSLPAQPRYINTWGDAIFVVMEEANPLVAYALALQKAVLETDWEAQGLPAGYKMNIRIALHAGPVFAGADPFTGELNFYGSHVNRAARLEPVTVPGHIYATEQFVGLLRAEQMAAGVSASQAVTCEYVGALALAKNFGVQVVYHLSKQINP